MSRNFLGSGQVPYIGQTYSGPVQLCGGGMAVPLFFDWISYGASSANNTINVLVSIQPAAPQSKQLKGLVSVYIDNTNSNVPIFVYCPDTRYTAVAQPNSAGWYPLYTNGTNLWVIGQGFVTGQIPQTTIFVSDIFIPPYTDTEIAQALALAKASPSITRGNTIYNTNFGAPALGDQTIQPNINLFGGPFIVPLFGTPLVSGFIYLTHIHVTLFFLTSANTGAINIQLFLESTGIAGTLFDLAFILGNTVSLAGPLTLVSLSGMNLKLDATQPWQLRASLAGGTLSAGLAQSVLVFTINPT